MAKSTKSPETTEVEIIDGGKASLPMVVSDKEKLQQQLRETISKIDEKLSDLEGTKTINKNTVSQAVTVHLDQYNTNCGQISNLQSEANVSLLVIGLSRIRMAQREYNEAAESVGLKKYPAFTWSGMDANALIRQFEQRIKLVSNSNLITQLRAEKKKLETFLSEDDRLAATLQSLGTLLKEN